MGREVRMVPKDWEHPTRSDGHPKPLQDGSFTADIAEWLTERNAFMRGERVDGTPLPPEAAGCSFKEWHGSRPLKRDYMPDWPESERTHYQMYETCSEGTPISPVMETPEELARWLTDNEASAFADMTATYEQWLATIKRGWAVSAMWTASTGLVSGVEAP